MFKNTIVKLLQFQTKRFIKKHGLKVVAVAGSVGKTSTKMAIAAVLAQKFRVRYQEGNHNTEVSVPLIAFELPLPDSLKNPFAWISILVQTEKMIRAKDAGIDVILLELGTDKPGDIASFKSYLHPDIAVVTSVSAEHMEFFKTMEAVAQEELSIASFSSLTLVNRDDVSEDYARFAETSSISTYGLGSVAEYLFVIEDAVPGQGFSGTFVSPELDDAPVQLHVIGEHNIKAVVAAGAVGIKLGLTGAEVVKGMGAVRPVAGRMNLLRGLERSMIIDDTYNSSPLAVRAALQTLYQFQAPQRIAILGSMNELGEFSAQAHEDIGKTCDPKLLDYVITIGEQAEKYLAPAAANRGCQVRSFSSPYEAGAFAHKVMQPGAVILVKGSQNRVFAEEAIKVLLHDTDDEKMLVRQSEKWMQKKREQFSAF